MTPLSRPELVELVQSILDMIFVTKVSEADLDAALDRLHRSVPHPATSDLFFYPHLHGLSETPTAEEIADAVRSYRPIEL